MASHKNYRAPPFKHSVMTLDRIDKYFSTTYFSDVNLNSRLITKKLEPVELGRFKADGRFEFESARKAEYVNAKIGDAFGSLWSTHWFRIKFILPADFVSKLTDEEEVLFYWDTGSEATIWDEEKAQPIGAFSCAEPHGCVRDYIPVSKQQLSSSSLEYLLEVACNKVLGEGSGTFIGPPDENVTYSIRKCHLAVRNKKVYSLLKDLKILHDIAKELKDTDRGYVALYTANQMVNILQSNAADAYDRATQLSTDYFNESNGVGQHVIHAVGHCHMDCAWLWPYEETKRKCARSWSATLDLMDRYPDWTFACSSAQQYEWVQVHYPSLFERIKKCVASGRFIPVGGSWVEMDGYLPSGESMCRQLLFGQRYFKREFGLYCTEFWLPDTFGYSAQLPQIVSHFRMTRFFTQKISWNLFNKFPHHTFYWRGLDGSHLLSHFAPGDSYHMEAKVDELVKTSNNFQDKGRSNSSLFLFGHGDGGQGPTQDILENLNSLRDVDGLPKVKLSTPGQYFEGIEMNETQNLCSWSGELYLEMHNGTYTSQAKIKWYNRKCESLLHNLELMATMCYLKGLAPYPYERLDDMWKKILLNQFHDILPGSSVQVVHDDAKVLYKEVVSDASQMREELVQAMTSELDSSQLTVFNSLSWPRTELISLSEEFIGEDIEQEDLNGQVYKLVEVQPLSVSLPVFINYQPVDVRRISQPSCEDMIVMENSKLYVEIDRMGRVCVLKTVQGETASRNLVSSPANQYAIYNDLPLFWDAWDIMDYHQETRQTLTDVLVSANVVEEGPLRGSVEVSIQISDNSYLKQIISLDAESSYLRVECEVHWHENRKLLKVEFPLDVISDNVSYECQFGHVKRPTHRNTSWDTAKFEVCCQKWMDLSDHSIGVAILNDSKYGCSVTDHSTLHLSLLRSSKYPDAHADMGVHTFSYAILPHNGALQEAGVIRSAHNFNNPLRVVDRNVSLCTDSLVVADQPAIAIDTVKAAECDREIREGERSVILRCYESFGGSCEVNLKVNWLRMKYVALCNGLEEEVELLPHDSSTNTFSCSFSPFQLKTFKVVLENSSL